MTDNRIIIAPCKNVSSSFFEVGNRPFLIGAYIFEIMEIQEIWKDVKNYEGIYQISNLGNVKRLNTFLMAKNGVLKSIKERILKQNLYRNGYPFVMLCVNSKSRNKLVHRLVAIAFIPNPLNLPQVNHRDEVKINNYVNNLEWITAKGNSNYGTKVERTTNTIVSTRALAGKNNPMYGRIGTRHPMFGIHGAKHPSSVSVVRIGDNGDWKKYENYSMAAEDMGVTISAISRAARGLVKTSCGYKWVINPKEKINTQELF